MMTTTATTDDAKKLRETVNLLDSLSQEAFDQIEAITKATLAALENPRFCRDTDTMATLFGLIRGLAQRGQDCINFEAEQVGCNFRDDAEIRRHEAFRQAVAMMNAEQSRQRNKPD